MQTNLFNTPALIPFRGVVITTYQKRSFVHPRGVVTTIGNNRSGVIYFCAWFPRFRPRTTIGKFRTTPDRAQEITPQPPQLMIQVSWGICMTWFVHATHCNGSLMALNAWIIISTVFLQEPHLFTTGRIVEQKGPPGLRSFAGK